MAPTPEQVASEQAAILADLTHDRRRKIPALTGIRGYAALWVVVYHCISMGWLGLFGSSSRTDQVPFLLSGYLGVELFFILSGFILTKIYGQAIASGAGLRDFAIGRVFRILPVYWLSLAALVAIVPLMHGHRWQAPEEHSLSNLLRCALLIQSWVGLPSAWNVPAWSLSTEWLAYIAFPVLAIAAARIRRPTLIVGCALTALLALALLYRRHGLTSLNNIGSAQSSFGLERCLCEFAIGVAMARLHQIGWTGARLGNALLLAGLVVLLPPMVQERFDLLAIVAFSLLVLSAGSASPWAQALLGNRGAHFLGEISFSIYVLHWPLLELVFRFAAGPTSLIVALAVLPVAVIPLAWTTWRWVEVPGQALGRRLVARLRARAPRQIGRAHV